MTQPDERTLECALRIKHSAELEPFLKWLRQRREDAREFLETNASDESLHRFQGRAQELREILLFIEGADKALDKLRGRK